MKIITPGVLFWEARFNSCVSFVVSNAVEWQSLDGKYLGTLLADNCIKISNSCFALTEVI